MLIYLQVIETEEDKNKFEDIYQKYRGLMYYVAYKRLHHEQDAEDAVHHAFMKIAENITAIDPVSPKTKQFVVTIASNSLSRLHIHSGNSWTKYNATYHRGLCNGGCGEFVLAQHYARTPGSNATCLGCGYVGNISIGLMSMGDKLS